eukprot:8619562-Heterocapsa_arctica.AAC.1
MTDDNKEETINAIGSWRHSIVWDEAGVRQKIEYIADFLATRPAQRNIMSKFGAVILSRIEAMNIIKMKKKASNFFATVAVM